MLPTKKIYTDWHNLFPGSGQGKHYPYLLDKIIHNRRSARAITRRDLRENREWNTLLDYGAGKGGTAQWLQSLIKGIDIDCYDPGNPQYANTPLKKRYDLVYSCDVLEHIEREDIHTVIEHTQSLSKNNIHIIDMTQAKKHLPDGRNAHVLLLDKYEWIELFGTHKHVIEEALPWSVPDPNYGTRERLCIWTRTTKRSA